MPTIPQTPDLLNNLLKLIEAHRPIFKQQRVHLRVMALIFAELLAFSRHTITQLLMTLGLTEQDWSAWYRLFSRGRFNADRASEVLFSQTLDHVPADAVYVVGGDATQTPRSSRKMEGAGWLRNLRTPAFMIGIHMAQRWFNGSWLTPAEAGYSRAIPLRWMPCFTEKSEPQVHAPRKEWQAALAFLHWVQVQLARCGRVGQRVLMVADGSYDHLELWKGLPAGVILLARSARNRALYHLPGPQSGRGRRRQYGQRANTPQQYWQSRRGWRKVMIHVRGRQRHLQVQVQGPFLRRGAPDCPLMLILVRGKDNARTRRQPLPFLVNAVQDATGRWHLPLPVETLLFWAWQRWELEVCHRELKASFGLGDKQCWHPTSAVTSVQWSAWVYALLVLAGYQTWGLCRGPDVPTRWWRGSRRWSLNTLWRAYRAALWGDHDFRPLYTVTTGDWGEKEGRLQAIWHAVFASVRA